MFTLLNSSKVEFKSTYPLQASGFKGLPSEYAVFSVKYFAKCLFFNENTRKNSALIF